MTGSPAFLVEIGTEELPPKALRLLSEVFRREIERGLDSANLPHGAASAFATPRRLAVVVDDLAVRQADQFVERRGPAVKAAFDADGNPTKAALGFATACGTDIESLGRLVTDKGEWLSFNAEIPGQETAALLPGIVAAALAALPVPKPMRWGSGDVEFVRPVHWVVLMLGEIAITAEILGVTSGTATRGHRFHAGADITISSAADYCGLLEREGHVLPDFAERRARIRELATTTAAGLGGTAIIDEALLDEVTALVEWPVAVAGSFDEHFLQLPREVLIASMQDHQKYFPVEAQDGALVNHFITISNIDSKDPDAVQQGNERVIRPRLSDAAFFWDADRKFSLEQRLDRLDGIVFEKRLGSLRDKTMRLQQLAVALAPRFDAAADDCARAAQLSRCDLVTDMVGEFPELQGVMGSYYAAHDGETDAVTAALREFYWPRFAGDAIGTSPAARCVAFADKLDTLVGIFAIGGAPTGDKDPYALRRAALGCIRIAIESGAAVDFDETLTRACDGYANVVATEGVGEAVHKFMLDRLRGYFAERKVPGSVVEAVLAVRPDELADIARRIDAVTAFRALPAAKPLASANKRIANILKKAGDNGATLESALLRESAEINLVDRIEAIADESARLIEQRDYTSYLSLLARLHEPINVFFDDVMVMCEDEKLRANRISLLRRIHDSFSRVADVARLND
jgi:glycyl-tRNA synthetase beta chain